MPPEDISKLKIDKSAKAFRPHRRRRVYLLAAALLLAGAAAILYRTGVIAPAVGVEAAAVSQVYPSQALSQLNASGYVVAQRKAAVASKVTGRLVEIYVEEGSRVKEGQIIARLESEDVLAARDQARANLKNVQAATEQARAEMEDARRSYERSRELVAKNYISRSEYDVSEARLKKAEAAVAAAEAAVRSSSAALKGAEVAVDYTLIRAPFDAVVLTKNADVGDIVTPIGAAANAKAAVVTIADLGSLEVEADVSETNIGIVKAGQPCEIQLDALPDSRFRGAVHTIVPTADRTKATILVKVRFVERDSRILPEMRAKVSFLSRPVSKGEEKPRTAVSQAAVIERGGRTLVFVINGSHAVERQVTTGQRFNDQVEILQGVEPGQRVVVRPPKGLKNGTPVKIVEK